MEKKMTDIGTIAENLEYHLTVGELRKKIEQLPDHIPVFYERIEDTYFQQGKGWSENCIVKVPDYMSKDEPEEDLYDHTFIRASGVFVTSRRGGLRKFLAITAHE